MILVFRVLDNTNQKKQRTTVFEAERNATKILKYKKRYNKWHEHALISLSEHVMNLKFDHINVMARVPGSS